MPSVNDRTIKRLVIHCYLSATISIVRLNIIIRRKSKISCCKRKKSRFNANCVVRVLRHQFCRSLRVPCCHCTVNRLAVLILIRLVSITRSYARIFVSGIAGLRRPPVSFPAELSISGFAAINRQSPTVHLFQHARPMQPTSDLALVRRYSPLPLCHSL